MVAFTKIIDIGTPAQDWARIINYNFTLISDHNHEVNYGLRIDSNSFQLGNVGDLLLNDFSIINISELVFFTNDIVESSLCLFVNTNNDLCYQTETFTLPITSGTSLNTFGLTQGFVVSGTPPVCNFDNTVNGLRLYADSGENIATLLVSGISAQNLNISDNITIFHMQSLANISSRVNQSKALAIILQTLPTVLTYITLPVTFKTFETASLYKVSDNGTFYWDLLTYSSATHYDLSYWQGSKNWIATNSPIKTVKKGIRYFYEEVSYTVGPVVDQTFLVIPLLANHNLVSFVPRLETSTAELNRDGFPLNTLPSIKILIDPNNNSVSATVSFNFQNQLFANNPMKLTFCIVYVERNFTMGG